MEALVVKLSKSGKTMLVGIKRNKYAVGYEFGWVSNPDGNKKGDKITDMPEPKATVQCVDDKGEPINHEDGTPVVRFTF